MIFFYTTSALTVIFTFATATSLAMEACAAQVTGLLETVSQKLGRDSKADTGACTPDFSQHATGSRFHDNHSASRDHSASDHMSAPRTIIDLIAQYITNEQ